MILRRTNAVARGAFTLMEMLVVVAIIVVLAGVGGYYYMGALDNAKVDAAHLQVKTLTNACQTFELNNDGQRPPSLQALLQAAANGKAPQLDDPKALMDPWGKPYMYDANGSRNGGTKPDIWTTSPRGIQIGNWPGAR